jgi:glycosyltransferase involved in cell wall biosynthesis
MIKVLGLALYGPLAASTRYRLDQYVPGLASLGIELKVRHLLGDDYLRQRFRGGQFPLSSMVSSGLSRLADLYSQNDYDLIIIYSELYPLLPGWMEKALLRKPYIYDLDDAFYLKYRSGRLGFARSFLGNKFDTLMESATAITAGNKVLAQYAEQFNTNTQYLPTVVDTTRYLALSDERKDGVFTVGWIGSPSTAAYLNELVAPLSLIGQEGEVRFVVIGGNAPSVPNVNVVEIDWNENTEIQLINSFDVGVMPLPGDDWARGKCAFKLIQYMACGIPVVASPVGANVDVVRNQCGMLASSPIEWANALRMLRDRPKMRFEMGQAGRERVVMQYSLHHNLPRLANTIFQIAGKN